MNGYALTAAIFQAVASLAWPAAIFGSVWLFRKQLIEMLPNFRAKYKDFELDFRLKQAEREAAALPPPPATPESEPTPEEKSRFEQLAEMSPRSAILQARVELEEALLATNVALGLPKPKATSILEMTRRLRLHKVLTPETSALLNDLRVIGNNAAHPTGQSDFTKEEACRYKALVEQAIDQLRLIPAMQ